MNEVLATDYLVPMRVLSPAQMPKDGRGFQESGVTDMADWNTQARSMIARHRQDPASIHTINTPVEYQVIGGEGKDLIPGELLRHGEDMQLNAMGIASQLHRGDLTIQTAPMAARLFEAHWQHVPAAANTSLKWMVEKITPNLGWKEFGVRLTPPKIADNMEHLMLLLQMMQAGEVTATTILGKLGLDRPEEQRRKSDEAIQSAKMEVKTDSELNKVVAGNDALSQSVDAMRAMAAEGEGGMPQQGAGGASVGPPAADPLAQIMAKIESFGSPQTPTSPMDMLQVAQEAAALLAPLPLMEKRQKLREIEQANSVIAGLIRDQIGEVTEEQDRQFVMQGRQMMQQGGGAPM